MMTRLEMPLKRELLIKGQPYRLTISQLGLRRKGCELSWLDLVNGDAALATALNATLAANRKTPSPGNPGSRSQRAQRAQAKPRG